MTRTVMPSLRPIPRESDAGEPWHIFADEFEATYGLSLCGRPPTRYPPVPVRTVTGVVCSICAALDEALNNIAIPPA